MNNANFGVALETALTRKFMTQAALAHALDVPANSVSAWKRERSSPRLATINKIAEALGMKSSELIALGESDG